MIKISAIAFFTFSQLAFASGYESISQAKVNELRKDPTTSVTESSQKVVIKETIFAVGNCTVSNDRMTGMRAQLSIAKCRQVGTQTLVTVDPKGLFNQETYVLEGSLKTTGFERLIESQSTGSDMSAIINPEERDILNEMLRSGDLKRSCERVAQAYQNINYTQEEKELFANCLGIQ